MNRHMASPYWKKRKTLRHLFIQYLTSKGKLDLMVEDSYLIRWCDELWFENTYRWGMDSKTSFVTAVIPRAGIAKGSEIRREFYNMMELLPRNLPTRLFDNMEQAVDDQV